MKWLLTLAKKGWYGARWWWLTRHDVFLREQWLTEKARARELD